MADQLKACPFCGGKPHAHKGVEGVSVQCTTKRCSASHSYVPIAAWNTRAEPVSVPTVQAGDWQQYAKEGESAQDVIERERKDNDALCTLLARARSAAPSQPVADHIGDANEMMPTTVQAKALTDGIVDWDRISEAAKQACNEYGQWMPERWLQLFVNAYNRNKS